MTTLTELTAQENADKLANMVVREYERIADRVNWPRDDHRWLYTLREHKTQAEMDLAKSQAEMDAFTEARKYWFYEVDAWIIRQRVILGSGGRAALLQPEFYDWLKVVDKAVATLTAQKPYAKLETIDRKRTAIFDTVTLDFAEGWITAFVFTIDKGGYGLSAIPQRFPCFTSRPFTARVEFDTLKSLVKWLPAERIDLSLSDHHLHLEAHRTRSRLPLVRMNPLTVGYWKGFTPQ